MDGCGLWICSCGCINIGSSKVNIHPQPMHDTLLETQNIVTSTKKQQMKVESLVKKVLGVVSTSSLCNDRSVVVIEIDAMDITCESIAEILAARLSISPDSKSYKTIPGQKEGVIAYLGHCYKLACEEYKTLQSSNMDANLKKTVEELLQEITVQVVSYAASSLFEPDLFELGQDGSTQLAKCLQSSNDLSTSITYGVSGASSSFYHKLCSEMMTQDYTTFTLVINNTIDSI